SRSSGVTAPPSSSRAPSRSAPRLRPSPGSRSRRPRLRWPARAGFPGGSSGSPSSGVCVPAPALHGGAGWVRSGSGAGRRCVGGDMGGQGRVQPLGALTAGVAPHHPRGDGEVFRGDLGGVAQVRDGALLVPPLRGAVVQQPPGGRGRRPGAGAPVVGDVSPVGGGPGAGG